MGFGQERGGSQGVGCVVAVTSVPESYLTDGAFEASAVQRCPCCGRTTDWSVMSRRPRHTFAKRLLIAGLATVLVVGVTAVAATAGNSSREADAKTVEVGNLASLTGLGGVFSGFNAGVKAFFSAENASGGIAGYKINLTSLDDGADPSKNAAAARQLVAKNKVVAIVGQATIADAASRSTSRERTCRSWADGPRRPPGTRPPRTCSSASRARTCRTAGSGRATLAKVRGIKTIAFIAQDFPAAVEDAVCRSSGAKYRASNGGDDPQGVDDGCRLSAGRAAGDRRRRRRDLLLDRCRRPDEGHPGGRAARLQGALHRRRSSAAALLSGLASAGLTNKVSGRVISAAFSLLPDDPRSTAPSSGRCRPGSEVPAAVTRMT